VPFLRRHPGYGGQDGTDSRLNLFQAINCLATITQSLRDRFRQAPSGQQTVSTVHIFEATPHITFEDSLPDVAFGAHMGWQLWRLAKSGGRLRTKLS
jgi:hypothetical protein